MGSCGTQGVPEERVSAEVATVLKRTALPLEMARRPAGQYSGGSKRKLALGIALVGGSSTILLDEPSSGMVRHHLSVIRQPGMHDLRYAQMKVDVECSLLIRDVMEVLLALA